MKREKCPCCGYPTLQCRGQDEICRLCDWQDENQDDAEAARLSGWPNGDYSLREARSNFKKNFSMYRGKSKVSDVKAIELIKTLLSAYGALEIEEQSVRREIWKEILQIEKELKMLQ